MHIVVVSFGPQGTLWPFYFHNENFTGAKEAADDLAKALGGLVMDDYGSSATFRKGEVHGVLLRDSELAAEAEVAGMVQGAENQHTAQSRLQARQGNGLLLPGGPVMGGQFRQ